MRLFFKDACQSLIVDGIWKVQQVLVGLAEQSKSFSIPGYTHLQRAQPVSIAHHLLAYVEMFARDEKRLLQVWESANICPLGSGAIAGTTLPIDREFVARELGFVDAEDRPRVTQNSMDAVSDRDVFIDFASACAVCGAHISPYLRISFFGIVRNLVLSRCQTALLQAQTDAAEEDSLSCLGVRQLGFREIFRLYLPSLRACL